MNKSIEEAYKLIEVKDKLIRKLEMQIKLSANLSKELERQKTLALETQVEINKSIKYASRIQKAMLPKRIPQDTEMAILWNPLNVVGGDFYIIREIADTVLVACIDCTGHGVPGALLSTLTNSILESLFLDENVETPGEYLSKAHNLLSKFLGQNGKNESKSNDGFDGSICIFNKDKNNFYFSGARASIFKISKSGKVEEYKGNRKSVGGSRTPKDYSFETQKISLDDGIIIMYTDGITDVMSEPPQSMLFGKERLLDTLKMWHGNNPDKIVKNVEVSLENHRNTEPIRDDMSMVVIKMI